MAASTPNVANRLSMFRDNMADFAFFMDAERDSIMKKMAHLIDYTKLILFIQGSSGAGKTSLLKHRFVHNKKANWRVAIIDAAYVKSSKELLSKLALDFRFSEQAHNQLPIELIVQQLDELRKSEQIALLVIDNVEQLDKNLCSLLAELAIRHQGLPALLRLVMFGQQIPKPLDQAIKQAAQENRDEQINNIILPRLSEQATADYIQHCLRHMGNNDSSLFDPATIHNIFEKSEGLIPRINDLANRVIGAPSKGAAPKGKNSIGALPLIAAALIVTILVSLFFFDQPTPPTSYDQAQLAGRGERVDSELPIPTMGSEPQRHAISIKDGEVKNSFTTPEPDEDAPQPIAELPPDPVVFEEPPLPAFESTIPEVTALAEADARTATPVAAEPVATPAAPSAAEIAPTTEKKKEAKPAAAPETSTKLTLKKFKAAPRSRFTLQLTAGANENAIKAFLQRHKLGDQAIYVAGTRGGKPWFTVVYGLYATRNDAAQAAKTLPATLKSEPWIRTVAGLQ